MEVLVSLAFTSWLLAMAYAFARSALMSARLHEAVCEAQESSVLGVDMLARDLRSAGHSASFAAVAAVRTAAVDKIEVASDLNADGDTADANELVAYSYDASKNQLMRATGGGSPQPLVSNIAAGGVRFSYRDAVGTVLEGSSGSVAAADRPRIRRVDALLQVEIPNPDPTVLLPLVSTTTTTVSLRNP